MLLSLGNKAGTWELRLGKWILTFTILPLFYYLYCNTYQKDET